MLENRTNPNCLLVYEDILVIDDIDAMTNEDSTLALKALEELNIEIMKNILISFKKTYPSTLTFPFHP
jgi:hypothetical protein